MNTLQTSKFLVFYFFALAIWLVTSTAQNVDPPSLAAQIADRDFLLQDAVGYSSISGIDVRLRFGNNGSISYNAGCNYMMGKFSVNGGTLQLSGLSSTLMHCSPEKRTQDIWFFNFLDSKPNISLDGATLILIGSDVTLTFLDSEVANPDRSLVGPKWIVKSYLKGALVHSFNLVQEPTLVFSADGTVQVFSNCSKGVGNYTANATTITFDNLLITEIDCIDTLAKQLESQIFQVLAPGVTTFEIDENLLTIERDSIGIRASTN